MSARKPTLAERQRNLRVAELDLALTKFMADHDEREISIWIAVFVNRLTRLSKWLLQDEDGQ